MNKKKSIMEMWKKIAGGGCLLCAGILALGSCSNEEWLAGGSGIRVSLVGDVEVTSRSTPAEIGKPLVSQFRLTVTKQGRTDAAYDGGYTSELIKVSTGTYDVTASFGTNPQLSLDNPYYVGTTVAEVTDDAETQTSIACQVGNALVSVKFGNQDKFDELYSSYGVKVQAGDLYVRLSNANSSQSAYFRAGSSPQLSFYGTLKENGKDVSMMIENENLPTIYAARDHAILTLSAKPVTSGSILTVDKVEVEKVTVTETIPVEWLPKPKVTGFGGGVSSLTYTETADAVPAAIHYTALMPVEDLEFTLDFQDEQFVGLNKTYVLSVLSDEDRMALTDAGIVLPTLDGTTKEGSLDLTALTAGLQTNAGAEVLNKVSLRVKANGRWSSETGENYEIHTLKPEFAVTVPPQNIWTREFTADEIAVQSGNIDKIKEDLTYQYRANGSTEWEDFSNGRKQVFPNNVTETTPTGHPEIKNYEVRALYRNAVATEPVAATLETPVQLPNSGMEDWHYSTVARSIITYNPWSSSGSSFWNTNNSYTTRYVSAASLLNAGSNPYNCFPAVSYVVGGHSGSRAAELRNTASGRGNTLPSNVLDLNKVAGELFTGDVDVTTGGSAAIPSGDHYTINTNGRSFASRPTAMRFWYKYVPLNSDTWRATIILMDEDYKVIISRQLTKSDSQGEWNEATLDLSYADDNIYAKCAHIYVVFSSTINTGNSMQWTSYNSYNLWKDNTLTAFSNTKCWVGSVLTIDDISLVYDK